MIQNANFQTMLLFNWEIKMSVKYKDKIIIFFNSSKLLRVKCNINCDFMVQISTQFLELTINININFNRKMATANYSLNIKIPIS